MSEDVPYANYRLTARLELRNRPGAFAAVAHRLARMRANLGAVDLVSADRRCVVRDVTFDVMSDLHGKRVIRALSALRGVRVVSVSDQIFLVHLGGKLRVESKFPVTTRNRLSMVYTPGVARVAEAIARDPARAHTLTIKRNSVAIVSDGSAVLGLGNLGAAAALPVLEGKAMLFREFAGIDAWPVALATQDPDEIVRTVERIAPVFGGINLEDISAPRCFDIESRLAASLDIPVMHDDQHGTAIVVLAALRNALRLVRRDMGAVRVVVSGVGAAGVACCRMLLMAGVTRLAACGRRGVVLEVGPKNLRRARRNLLGELDRSRSGAPLRQALRGADVFIGLSQGNILRPWDLDAMRRNRIVFAMANPDPEVDPMKAVRRCRVFATGRSDLPNQINNALAFPGVFRGALDVRASAITDTMKLAAAGAIAALIRPEQLNEEYIVPSLFDKRVVPAVAAAVARAASAGGVARRSLSVLSLQSIVHR
ncbi:MAG TPA: NAD-dependent malic enzyme [bacterium]